MKKRLIELTLTAMIVCAAFTGCGKNHETTSPETTAIETIEEIEYQADETETETETQPEQNDMVYLDDYVLPKWKAPVEICQMLDDGAVFFEECEIDDIDITNRNGKYYIELCICQVDDISTGDGRVLNYCDENYNYVYVGDMPEFNLKNGDIVAKYFVYNPLSDAEDDIILEYSVFITDAYRK